MAPSRLPARAAVPEAPVYTLLYHISTRPLFVDSYDLLKLARKNDSSTVAMSSRPHDASGAGS